MQLSKTEIAFLELVATKPLTDLAPFHLEIARRLAYHGFVLLQDGSWYPTAAGLLAIRQTVH